MYNILLLGDSKVGKTALATRFVSNTFDEDYEPTLTIHHVKAILSRRTRGLK